MKSKMMLTLGSLLLAAGSAHAAVSATRPPNSAPA